MATALKLLAIWELIRGQYFAILNATLRALRQRGHLLEILVIQNERRRAQRRHQLHAILARIQVRRKNEREVPANGGGVGSPAGPSDQCVAPTSQANAGTKISSGLAPPWRAVAEAPAFGSIQNP